MDSGLSRPFRYTDQRSMKLELSPKESQLLNNFDFDEPTLLLLSLFFFAKSSRVSWLTRPMSMRST